MPCGTQVTSIPSHPALGSPHPGIPTCPKNLLGRDTRMLLKSVFGMRTGELCSSSWPKNNLPRELGGNWCSGAQSLPGKRWQHIPSSEMLHGSVLSETSLTISLQLSCCLGVPEEWRDSHYLADREFGCAGDVKEDFECRVPWTDSYPSIHLFIHLPTAPDTGSSNKPVQVNGKERKNVLSS